jgi:hypothetical protein
MACRVRFRAEPRDVGKEGGLPFWQMQAASMYYSVLPQKFIDDAGPFLSSWLIGDIIKAVVPSESD